MISKSQQNMAILDDEIKFSQNMNELPKKFNLDKSNCDNTQTGIDDDQQNLVDHLNEENKNKEFCENIETKANELKNETRIQLSFSVDRLLNDKLQQNKKYNNPAQDQRHEKCCGELSSAYSCCSIPNCLVNTTPSTLTCKGDAYHQHTDEDMRNTSAATLIDFKSIVRPTPLRPMGNSSESVSSLTHFSSLTPTSLIRFHHAQMQQQKQLPQHFSAQPNFTLSALMHPLCGGGAGLKPLQMNSPHIGVQNFTSAASRFNTKINFDIPSVRANLACISTLRQHHLATANSNETHMNFSSSSTTVISAQNSVNANTGTGNSPGNVASGKRKRSWSRAVFSNLQRKGLEIQFQQQKYITKPDRRKLAARLNLTDAQVKVWFQNRRMKWRHTRENLKSGQEKQPGENACADTFKANLDNSGGGAHDLPGYSSDGSSSLEMSEAGDDDDDSGEIDVVE